MKIKKCKQCKKTFQPQRPLQYLCSPACAIQRLADSRIKRFKKEVAEEKKAYKEKYKTVGEYEGELQAEINAIVRLIDYSHPCLSCFKNGKPQAGHYHSRGANKTIRFHLFNIWGQDYRCNVELSGNITGFNKGLIEVFGKDLQEYIEHHIPLDNKLIKWTKDDLIGWTKKARQIRKELEKEAKVYSKDERLILRTEINNRLGIYQSV